MLRSVESLKGLPIRAVDGEIGSVSDFYFDGKNWGLRYLVIDTGKWLPGRKVLISPTAIGRLIGGAKSLPVQLTRQKIEDSPEISFDSPVSRQHESDLVRYFGWPAYWIGYTAAMADPGTVAYPPEISRSREPEITDPEADPNLRSAEEVKGYYIQAEDGDIGHIEDFIVEDDEWTIRYIVVDTRNWLPGDKVLIAPSWIREFSWANSKAVVGLTREEIRNSPIYDSSAPVNRQYETTLYDYYGRPRYWSS